ncbi:MAG: hypothetical protein HYV27_21450 [Candidatus Hydrogenedentes bacterium]|nr:hypothetical protein [Candidatus Hydrogenedentota bacterium]
MTPLRKLSFNLFDLLLVLALALFVAAGYRLVMTEHRVAPPYAGELTVRWARITLTLPPGTQWLCELAKAQPEEKDPRNGEPIARVMGCVGAAGAQEIEVQVRALVDAQDRLLFKNERLVPGRNMRIETERAVFEGIVHDVALLALPAPAV